MRKRVLIAVIGAVVAAAAALVLVQPKKGSAEWHKRESGKAR